MLELTGLESVLRGLGVLYWLLAAGAIALALWKGKTRRSKAIWTAVAIAVFGYLPTKMAIEQAQRNAYAREAWAYFKKLCDEKSGEKIYKTYTGVKSVLVTKPLPPATGRNLHDQFWYGDPYSDATPLSDRGASVVSRLIGTLETRGLKANTAAERLGFEFVESADLGPKDGAVGYVKYSYAEGASRMSIDRIEKPTSRFGVSWEDISTPEDRKYWVAGSRLRVVDLNDNTIVADRIGFFIEAGFGSQAGARRPWLASRGPNTTCPRLKTIDFDDRFFIQKVLNPAEENRDGK